MDNTIENRNKFFVLYWGQPIQTYEVSKCTTKANVVVSGWNLGFLTLKPLSLLSDDDAIRLFGLSKYNKIEITRHFSGKNHVGVEFRWVDDLMNNSDGYSYSSIGLSIPEITHKQAMLAISMGYYIGDGTEIEYGWAKLKGESNADH